MYRNFWHRPQKLLSSTKLTLENCATESECCKLIQCYWAPFMATLWYLQLMDHRLDMPDKIILLYYFNNNTTMIIFSHSLLVKFTREQWRQSFHGWMLFCFIWDNSDVEGEDQANFTGLIQLDFYYWYCYFLFSLSQPGLYSIIAISERLEVMLHGGWISQERGGNRLYWLRNNNLCTQN